MLWQPPCWPVKVLWQETYRHTGADRLCGHRCKAEETRIAQLFLLFSLSRPYIVIFYCLPHVAEGQIAPRLVNTSHRLHRISVGLRFCFIWAHPAISKKLQYGFCITPEGRIAGTVGVNDLLTMVISLNINQSITTPLTNTWQGTHAKFTCISPTVHFGSASLFSSVHTICIPCCIVFAAGTL